MIRTNPLIKLALYVDLQDHQSRVRRKLSDRSGLLVYHGLGSGKTISSIAAAEDEGGAEVITPASLRENFKKELKKVKAKGKYDVSSYEGFVSNKPDVKDKVLIVDEAHRLRTSSSKRSQVIRDKALEAKKIILLTGTPIVNKPHEIAPLINMVAKDSKLPLAEKEFLNKFTKRVPIEPGFFEKLLSGAPTLHVQKIHNEHAFRHAVKGLIDYHPGGDKEHFPEVSESVIPVPLTDKQVQIYKTFQGKLSPKLKYAIEKRLPPDKEDITALNYFANSFRQISNTGEQFDIAADDLEAPKLHKILEGVKSSPGPAVIYSNYLSSGLDPLKRILDKEKIPSALFTGKMNDKEKKKVIEDYNKGKLKALLISSSGGEGLDLKKTRQVHVMEPHWHEPKIHQVIGRAARYKSHSDLPPEDRRVEVYRYLAQLPSKQPGAIGRLLGQKPTRDTSIDEYLADLSKQKEHLNEQFLRILREEGSKEK